MTGLIAVYLLHRRRVWSAALVLAVLGTGLFAVTANASIENLSEEQMVERADYIVEGAVTSVDSHYTANNSRVVTDIQVTVTGAVKGRLNKSAPIFMTVPGGRVGNFVSYAVEMPHFTEGESVWLYLVQSDNGLSVLCGKRGKYEITTDEKTGVKYIVGGSVPAETGLKTAPDAVAESDEDAESDGRIPLEKYEQYVQELVKKQEAQKK